MRRASVYGHELDRHRRVGLEFLPGGREPPGVRIDAEHNQAIRILVSSNQKRTGRVNPEAAWSLSHRGHKFHLSEGAFRGIDREDGDTVVAAVGPIDELPGRMYLDFGSAVIVGDGGSLGQRGDGVLEP